MSTKAPPSGRPIPDNNGQLEWLCCRYATNVKIWTDFVQALQAEQGKNEQKRKQNGYDKKRRPASTETTDNCHHNDRQDWEADDKTSPPVSILNKYRHSIGPCQGWIIGFIQGLWLRHEIKVLPGFFGVAIEYFLLQHSNAGDRCLFRIDRATKGLRKEKTRRKVTRGRMR